MVYKLIVNLDKIDETIKTEKNDINENINTQLSEMNNEISDISDNVSQILLNIYPIGSVYINTVDTNPSDFFGGTWKRIAQGRTLIGEGISDREFSIGSTGGESTHRLSISEMPAHTHNYFGTGRDVGGSGGSNSGGYWSTRTTNSTGGNVAHNNLPPYLVVYIWERVA